MSYKEQNNSGHSQKRADQVTYILLQVAKQTQNKWVSLSCKEQDISPHVQNKFGRVRH